MSKKMDYMNRCLEYLDLVDIPNEEFLDRQLEKELEKADREQEETKND